VASDALFVTGVATIVRVEFLPFLLGAIITVLGFMVTDGIRLQRAAIPAEPRTEVAS
jgi:preprotein translocase subunit SecF